MRRSLMVITALTAILAACSEHTAPTDGDGTAIRVEDNFFSPQRFDVASGATVSWTWRGNNQHNVTFEDGPASATQTNGQYQRQFTTAGTYNYQCTIHGVAMSGSVVVQ